MVRPRRQPLPNRSALLPGLLILGLALHHIDAVAGRCGGALVEVGQRSFEVKERCGAPDYRVDYPLRGPFGQPLPALESHWYYNSGPQRFIRMLVFHNDVLVKAQRLGRGFHPHSLRSCSPQDLRRGVSEFELIEKCGPPLSSRLLWRGYPLVNGSPSGNGFLAPAKELVFEFGPGQFRRAVTLEGGRIVAVERLNKPH